MKTIAIGSKTFVTGFQLAGIEGINVEDHNDLMKNVNSFIDDGDVGLILVSDDVALNAKDELTEIKAKRSTPIIFEVPAPGSKIERTEYRDMLKQILGV